MTKQNVQMAGAAVAAVFLLPYAAMAGTYTLTVAEGETNTFAQAVKAKGVAFTSGDDIVKDGLGTLVADATFANDKIKSFTVQQGVLVSEHDNPAWFGLDRGNSIHVNDGASLVLKGSSITMLSRHMYAVGSGASGLSGAIVSENGGTTSAMYYDILADAVFHSTCGTGDAMTLQNSTIWFQNGSSRLFLRGVSDSRFYVQGGTSFTTRGVGTLVIDGTRFYTRPNSTCKAYDAETKVALCLMNGATFEPGSQALVDAFDTFLATADSTLGSGSNVSPNTIDLVFKNWQGAPTVDDLVTSLAIENSFKVNVDDLKNGRALALKGPLSFGDSCAFELVGDIGELPAQELTVAASETALTGLPAFKHTKDNYRWTLQAGADGKSLKLVFDDAKPEGAIDVTAWGVTAGAAVTNEASAFNARMAACAAGAVLYFPKGDYYFDGTLEVGAKDGLTLCGLDEESVLHVCETATAVIRATGTKNLTVRRLVLADCAGVAVAATGTENLTVTNCWYDAIGGALADVTGETYPIAATDAVDTFVRCNQTLDGAFYTAHAYLAGASTKKSGSEPLGDSGFILCVSPYATDSFATAMARSGRASYPSGGSTPLIKAGQGTLLGSADYGSLINGITIEAGTYAYSAANELGKAQSSVTVRDGGTLYVMNEPSYVLLSRQLDVSGFGAPDRQGAVVFAPEACGEMYSAMSIVLNGKDAQFYCESTTDGAYAGIFRFATLACIDGAKLYLKSASPKSGFRSECSFKTGGGSNRTGSLVVDGCTFYVSREYGGGTHSRGAGSDTSLVLTNGATFRAGCAAAFVPFGGIESSAGCVISAGKTDDAAHFDAAIDRWTGCGTITDVLTSLTINRSMTLRADDLLAGRFLTAAGGVTFGGGSLLKLTDGETLKDVRDPLTFVSATTGVTGRPKRDKETSSFYGKTVCAADDGKSLYLDQTGLTIFVR